MSYWISQSVDGAPLTKATHAEGVYVYGEGGKRYIDSTGGPGLFSLGHGHPEVTAAIKDQFDRMAYGFSMTFTTDVVEEFSESIVTAAGADHFGGVLYSSSGSEANEHALKAGFNVIDWTANVIFIVVIGGIGTIEGPIVGVIVFFVLRELLADFGSWYLIVLGAAAVLMMLRAPQGVWGLIAERFDIRFFPVQRRLVFDPASFSFVADAGDEGKRGP